MAISKSFLCCKLFRMIKFFFIILLREATLESNVAPTNRNSSAFLLNTNKIFSNVELFSIFLNKFFLLIFTTETKCCWNNQLFCLPSVKKILIFSVWTEKILFTNKRTNIELIKMPVWILYKVLCESSRCPKILLSDSQMPIKESSQHYSSC